MDGDEGRVEHDAGKGAGDKPGFDLQHARERLGSATKRAGERLGPAVGRVSEAFGPQVARAFEAVKANPWWVASIVVSLAVAIFLVFTFLRPGGIAGPGADARAEVEMRVEDITVYPSDATIEGVLGVEATKLWEDCGLNPRDLYDAILSRVKIEIKDVDASNNTARVTAQVTHPDIELVKNAWFEKLRAYPATDEEREYIKNASYTERQAVALRMLQDCFADRSVQTTTSDIALTLNRGNTGWNIVNSGWERAVLLDGTDIGMFVKQNVVFEQPEEEE